MRCFMAGYRRKLTEAYRSLYERGIVHLLVAEKPIDVMDDFQDSYDKYAPEGHI